MKRQSLLAGAVLVAALAIAPPAHAQAQSVSGTAGPAAVPNIPVQVCVQSSCWSSPALSSVWLTLSALVEANTVAPRFSSSSCPSGTGVALVVTGGSTSAIVTGLVDGTRPTGARYQQPTGAPVILPAGATMTVSACANWLDVLLAGVGGTTLLGLR